MRRLHENRRKKPTRTLPTKKKLIAERILRRMEHFPEGGKARLTPRARKQGRPLEFSGPTETHSIRLPLDCWLLIAEVDVGPHNLTYSRQIMTVIYDAVYGEGKVAKKLCDLWIKDKQQLSRRKNRNPVEIERAAEIRRERHRQAQQGGQ